MCSVFLMCIDYIVLLCGFETCVTFCKGLNFICGLCYSSF